MLLVKMPKVKNSFLLFFYLVSVGLVAQDTRNLSGTVLDAATGEPLPFATVSLKGTSLGTVSNAQGYYTFRIPGRSSAPLVANFIGYEPFEITVADIKGATLDIRLAAVSIELAELVIRPLTPEEYIKLAISKFPDNYASNPFQSKAYYREKLAENGNPLKYTEGFFKSHYPNYAKGDTTQHQLLLYNEVDDPAELAFMLRKRNKKEFKKRRKAEKKGEAYEPDESNDIIDATFGGPSEIFEDDPISNPGEYLDSTKFKKYKYEYAGAANYLGRQLLIISFKSKGTVDHVKTVGKIYFDYETDAIAAIETSGKIVIPAWARPILFAAGFAINKPYYKQNLRYQLIGDKWYPENFFTQANIGVTKRYMFAKDERSDFEIQHLLTIHSIDMTTDPISEENQFDPEKDMKEQIKPIEGLSWETVNTLAPESIETEATEIEE